jgi:large subunit ribosomal protein L25
MERQAMSILNAEMRAPEASNNLRALRRRGILPMAIIEKGKGTLLIQASEKDVREVLKHSGSLRQFQIKLEGESKPRDVILKAVDKDYVRNDLLHIAVMQVADTDVVTIDVPIVFVGTPEVVAQHEATLLHTTDALKVKGQLKKVPSSFEVDVSHLEMGQSISVSDIPVPEGIEVLTSSDATVASVKQLRVQLEVEEAPEAGMEEGAGGEAATAEAGEEASEA